MDRATRHCSSAVNIMGYFFGIGFSYLLVCIGLPIVIPENDTGCRPTEETHRS